MRRRSQTRVGTWRGREGALRLCLQVGPNSCYWISCWVFGARKSGLAAAPPPPQLLHSHCIFVQNTTASVLRTDTGHLLYKQVCLKTINDAMKRVLLCLE